MTLDIEALLEEASPQEEIVRLCLRGDLRGRWERLNHELQNASREGVSLGDISPATRIAREMEDLRHQLEAATAPFLIRALHPHDWSRFADTRPTKTKDQPEDEWDKTWHDWLCRMVALTCADPVMTPEQVDRLVGKLSNRQWVDLADTAWRLNAERERIPFSVAASALITVDDERSKRPARRERPSPSGSGGNSATSPPTATKKTASSKR